MNTYKKHSALFDIYSGLFVVAVLCGIAFADIQKVTEGSGGEHSRFGWDVALSGRYALISAANETNEFGTSAGAVYAYLKVDGVWTNAQKLEAPEASAYTHFGHAVAMDSNYAVISAIGSFANGPFSGCAYIFSREGQQWIFQQKIVPNDGAPSARFGQAVDINGKLVLIGAHQASGAEPNSGAAYLFRNKNGLWQQEAKLVAADGQKDDFFGWSVALNDNGAALVGAYSAKGRVDKSGAAYLFENRQNGWEQSAKLVAKDGESRDLFAFSLDLSKDYALIGAYQHQNREQFGGAAYLFHFDGSAWAQQLMLQHSKPADHDYFGIDVCLSDSIAAVSASRDENDEDSDEGAVYLFEHSQDTWKEIDKLVPPDGSSHDHYGLAVAMAGPTILVGSRLNDNITTDDGAAYFNNPGDETLVQPLPAIPQQFALHQNYPNPFNPATAIQFDLPEPAFVTLKIYDVLGHQVRTLANKTFQAGFHTMVWDGHDDHGLQSSSGLYLYQIKAGSRVEYEKMMLLR